MELYSYVCIPVVETRFKEGNYDLEDDPICGRKLNAQTPGTVTNFVYCWTETIE